MTLIEHRTIETLSAIERAEQARLEHAALSRVARASSPAVEAAAIEVARAELAVQASLAQTDALLSLWGIL